MAEIQALVNVNRTFQLRLKTTVSLSRDQTVEPEKGSQHTNSISTKVGKGAQDAASSFM